MTDKTCPVCGKTFTASRADSRFCSGTCRQKAHRDRKRKTGTGDPYLLVCAVCGHEYLAYRADSRFCSRTCRAFAGHRRQGRRLDSPVPQPAQWRTGWEADWLDEVKRSGKYWDRRSWLR